ncbi:hypothetical protein I309_03548 [Cryptococcus deuterogattii LA55]|nr:hypothetical protein I309_03548 [Cryptococcus deuterogattii LA55]KIR73208.1 hypothetical protein I310_02872 [Cryptococcus deuterogattii CA1014]KIR91543.1 hypothetical protein I304_04365 [Cryptococcus deuterogattii CBS 10090]
MGNTDVMSFPEPNATEATSHGADSKAEIEMVENVNNKQSNIVKPATLMPNGHLLGSIFISPPTPEQIDSPTEEVTVISPTKPAIRSSSPRVESMGASIPSTVIPACASPRHSPLSSNNSSPASTAVALPIPLYVLPEVRSSSRKSLALTADSPQSAVKRDRRMRISGFTELTDSNQSSPASSAKSSPEDMPQVRPPSLRRASASLSSVVTEPKSARVTSASMRSIPSLLPRRHPNIVSNSAPIHVPSRRRDNGLRLNFDGITPVSVSPEAVKGAVHTSPYTNVLVRKKSGEILKSALKQNSSDSSYVHFDTQLERVKLFLHDQKPQVVSHDSLAVREDDGDEFPPSLEEEKVLKMSLPNFPTYQDPSSDLYLESLFLSEDRKSIKGVTMCKNIAFQKWVAVRFTLDWWQTTSEVTAVHKESVRGGTYDRFVFTIKLGDMLHSIEQKTLYLAVRYNAGGKEVWDSNGGQNYLVKFIKERPVRQPLRGARDTVPIQPGMGKAVGGRSSQWSVTGDREDRMADLRAKLSMVSEDDAGLPPFPSGSRHVYRNRDRKGPDGPRFAPHNSKATELPKKGVSLAARYDFGAALHTARRNSSSSPIDTSFKLLDVKTGLLNSGQKSNVGHAASSFYSPKFDQTEVFGDDAFASSGLISSPEASHVPVLKVESPSPPATEATTPVSMTPPKASPLPSHPLLYRTHSAPAKFTIGDPTENSSSEESPPQLDNSSISTITPPESPMSPSDLGSFGRWSPTTMSSNGSLSSLASYSSLIEQFCWAGDPSVTTSSQTNYSTGSLDDYFSYSHSGFTTPRAGTPNATFNSSITYTGDPNITPTRNETQPVDNVVSDGFVGRTARSSVVF